MESTNVAEQVLTPSSVDAEVQHARHGENKRKRASPMGEHWSDDEHHDESSTRPAPKRACNECRQQKLRCDVQPEPFSRCSRCTRLKLECRIDANFRRVGKRSRNAEMEREIVELRRKLAERDNLGSSSPSIAAAVSSTSNNGVREAGPTSASNLHEELAGSLLDLRNSTNPDRPKPKMLSDLLFQPEKIEELFQEYFAHYHPFLPILDPEKPPEHYFELSPLLFWVVITTASRRYEDDPTLMAAMAKRLPPFIWSTIADVPQNYHVVKALAILCTWPLPAKSTSTDPTFMLSGVMMQIALQTGLHRPSHVQEFSRHLIELREEDVRDRLRTWAVCNIVTQNLSTALGQPPKSLYDWTLTSHSEPDYDNGLPPELFWRLQIERFCNKVSQKFYNNRSDPIGVAGDQERAAWSSLLVEDYRDLERQISRHGSKIDELYLQAACLHLRLSAFFDSSTAQNYVSDLLELYFTTTKFLQTTLSLDPSQGQSIAPSQYTQLSSSTLTATNTTLRFAPFHFIYMTLAGGFCLMKLLNSFFTQHIDVLAARSLFNATIRSVRAMSVTNNDLPARLAEVLAQLWRSLGATSNNETASNGNGGTDNNSLQLKVRCRMSMSLLFDSVWRWREENQFGKTGDGTTASLDSAVANNPTIPEEHPHVQHQHTQALSGSASTPSLAPNNDASTPSQVNSANTPYNSSAYFPPTSPVTMLDPATFAASYPSMPMLNASGTGPGATMAGVNDYNYEVFDPLTWMLDGTIDLPLTGSGSGGGGAGSDSMMEGDALAGSGGMLGAGVAGGAASGYGGGMLDLR